MIFPDTHPSNKLPENFSPAKIPAKTAVFFLLLFFTGTFLLSAGPFWFDLETGAAFTGYNNVQIPADTGTRFSLADDLDPGTVWYYRIRGGVDIGRHSISLLYAPLKVKSSGSADRDIEFFGETFAPGTLLEGTYVFNSYRFTWAYRIADKPRYSFAAGITGKVRDASIGLKGENTSSELVNPKRSNLGVVPLIHLDFRWHFSPAVSLMVAGDGLAAPQGRAEDFLAALLYRPEPDIELRLGYRILEGGSDGGGSVYTFSLFHYIAAGVYYRF